MAQTRHEIYNSNLDINQAAPSRGLVEILDGYIDQYGIVRKRPGLRYISDTISTNPTDVGYQGLYYWKEKSIMVGVYNGYIGFGRTLVGLKDVKGMCKLNPGKISFATNGYWLFIASTGGGNMVVWDGLESSNAEYVNTNDPIAPADVISVSSLDGYILAAERNTKRVWYTATPDISETVRPMFDQYFSAIGTPGYTLGIYTINREIHVIKTDSIELWFNDGVAPFRRYEGAVIAISCLSPTSISVVDNQIWFMGADGFVTRLVGRNPDKVSVTADSRIRRVLYKEDCRIFQADTFAVVTFPVENITYVYDLITKKWYQWGWYNSTNYKYEAYLGLCAEYGRDAEAWIVGCRVKNNVAGYSEFKKYWSLDKDNIVRFAIRTAFLDHNTFQIKRSLSLTIKTVVDPVLPKLQPIGSGGVCEIYTFTYDTTKYIVNDITGLPPTFTFNQTTQTISGGSGTPGIYPITINITLKETQETLTYTDTLRILPTYGNWEITR